MDINNYKIIKYFSLLSLRVYHLGSRTKLQTYIAIDYLKINTNDYQQ